MTRRYYAQGYFAATHRWCVETYTSHRDARKAADDLEELGFESVTYGEQAKATKSQEWWKP